MKFTISIIPKAQMRARHGRTRGGFSVTYKAPAQAQAENDLIAMLAAHRPAAQLEGAIIVNWRAYLPRPASKPKKWHEAAQAGRIRPTGKPDKDNLEKHLFDCLTALSFWRDDAQVVEGFSGKYYDDGRGPRWEIEITELHPAQPERSERK